MPRRTKTQPIAYPPYFVLWDSKKRQAFIASKLKHKKHNLYPSVVCIDCAEQQKLVLKTRCSTFYSSVCEACRREGMCTEVRDYGYPEIVVASQDISK